MFCPFSGIVFTNMDPDPESTYIPPLLDYKIRMDSAFSESTTKLTDQWVVFLALPPSSKAQEGNTDK